ncbi:hypothetical protein ACJX0J_039887, partial [Zea mays]
LLPFIHIYNTTICYFTSKALFTWANIDILWLNTSKKSNLSLQMDLMVNLFQLIFWYIPYKKNKDTLESQENLKGKNKREEGHHTHIYESHDYNMLMMQLFSVVCELSILPSFFDIKAHLMGNSKEVCPQIITQYYNSLSLINVALTTGIDICQLHDMNQCRIQGMNNNEPRASLSQPIRDPILIGRRFSCLSIG